MLRNRMRAFVENISDQISPSCVQEWILQQPLGLIYQCKMIFLIDNLLMCQALTNYKNKLQSLITGNMHT